MLLLMGLLFGKLISKSQNGFQGYHLCNLACCLRSVNQKQLPSSSCTSSTHIAASSCTFACSKPGLWMLKQILWVRRIQQWVLLLSSSKAAILLTIRPPLPQILQQCVCPLQSYWHNHESAIRGSEICHQHLSASHKMNSSSQENVCTAAQLS